MSRHVPHCFWMGRAQGDIDSAGTSYGGLGGDVRQPDQRSGKPPQGLSEIGAGGGEDRVDRVTVRPGHEAPIHPVIALEVDDLGFDRAAMPSPIPFTERCGCGILS